MLFFDDVKRLLAPLKRKIYLMIGRAIVTYINNSEKTQKVQLRALAHETISDVERIQEYGLETYPWSLVEKSDGEFEGSDPDKKAESEAVIVFTNGDRARGVVVAIGDRYHRLTDLAQGEVALYTFEDKEIGGHRIHLKNDQIIDMDCINMVITCTVIKGSGGGFTVNCKDANINCTGSANIAATSGVNIDGGAGNLTGVVTGQSICHFTGSPHGDVSGDVKSSKG